MIRIEDVPPHGTLSRQNDEQATTTGDDLPISAYLPQIRTCLEGKSHPFVIVTAPTGSGKTECLPMLVANETGERVLYMTTSSANIAKASDRCPLDTCYRMGLGAKDEKPIKDSRIVYTSVRLSLRWYAAYSTNFLDEYSAVVLDEF